MNQGKVVILTIAALALGAAGFSVWFRYHHSHRAVELWTPAHAARMRNAGDVEVWRLGTSGGEEIEAPTGETAHVIGRRALVNVADLNYVRKAMLTDAFFEWDASAECEAHWTFALQFKDKADGTTTLWFDDQCSRVTLAETGTSATMNKGLLNSVRRFLDRYGPPVDKTAATKK
jgi:hypothetical protein